MAQIARYAKKYGIPISLALALVGKESGGSAGAVSPKGATGLTQVMPSTAAGMYGISEAEAARRLRNPDFALDAGFRYLATQKRTFKTWRLALAAYNAGPNAVKRYHGIPPYPETEDYVHSILSKARASTPLARPPAGGGLGSPSLEPPSAPSGPDLEAVAQEGLSHLAQGDYDPRMGLQVLSDATQAAQSASRAVSPRLGATSASPSFPGAGASKRDRRAVALVQEYLGTPYVWGGSTPKGFDCSGLLQYTWGKVGVSIPRTTYDQWRAGRSVPRSKLRAGDAVFFRMGASGPEHVGMYIGGGKFIEAPHSGATVRISKLAGRKDYAGARRFA